MGNEHKIVIKRDELYERVWQTPARQLAKKYELSDARLSAICRLLKVPKPPIGYWTKIKHGKSPRRPPLPSIGPDEKTEFVHIVDEDRIRPVLVDPDIQALIERVPEIRVQSRLISPDLLVRNANVWLGRQAYMYSAPSRLPHLSLNVYPDSKGRALRLMDGLIKGIKKLGYVVRGEDDSNNDQYFEILGQRTRFQLKERSRQIDHVLTKEERAEKAQGREPWTSKYDFLPTGHLDLILSPETWVRAAYKKTWSDTMKKTLEDQLRDIIRGLILLADGQRREAEERKKAELAEAEQRKFREEAERRQAEEAARLRELDNCVARWVHSRQLKAFIREIKARFGEGSHSDQSREEFSRWVLWASAYAERADPISIALCNLTGRAKISDKE